MIKRRIIVATPLIVLLLTLSRSALAMEPFPLQGWILDNDNVAFFLADDGRQYELKPGSVTFLKYTNYRIEIVDAALQLPDTIHLSCYRILESEAGAPINSSVRTIMTVKNKRPNLEFKVRQNGEAISFSLHLINPDSEPIEMHFPSSQKVDFVIMTNDKQDTLWRWSWNKEFELGFNDFIIPPREEIVINEEWNYRDSYLEDGEYIAFAELHCLPHGVISELKPVVIHNSTSEAYFHDYCLPLKVGNSWEYQVDGTGQSCTMRITGLFQWGSSKYFIFSFFPDGLIWSNDLFTGSSRNRLIRFDPDNKRYVEWHPDGEKPLLFSASDRRLVAAKEPCRTAAGEYTHCLEYLFLEDRSWSPRVIFVPGIGIAQYLLNGENGPTSLNLTRFRLATPTNTGPKNIAQDSFAETKIRIRLHKKAKFPETDLLCNLKSDGTYVILKNGILEEQGLFPPADLFAVLQSMENNGLFQLSDSYGENPVSDPLTIELLVENKDRIKRIIMKTSQTDKPPLEFWTIIDGLEVLINKIRQNKE